MFLRGMQAASPIFLLSALAVYIGVLMLIGFFTSRKNDVQSFYLGSKKAPWYLIGFGMIADSLSGVTFISIPGEVGTKGFLYLQVVLGYVIGYLIIARILIPLYFAQNITSIYTLLGDKLGDTARKTGAGLFQFSRLLGAGARLYLAVMVLQRFFLDPIHIPAVLTMISMIGLMLLYTTKGGIKTLIYTDAFQATAMLLALITIMIVILNLDNMSVWNAISSVPSISNKDWIDLSPTSPTFFLKQIIGGMLIALTMTGLDQSMMQKSLSCKNETDATKNISWFGIVVFFVNFAFLIFGALLYSYANQMGISPPDGKTDLLFPELAMNHLGPIAALAFVLGLLAATFSSADSVLTTLTTSFCFDFLDFENKKNGLNAARTRKTVHFIMGGLLFLVMLLFDILNKEAIIQTILTVAGYTYGPLLGLFLFAIKFKRKIHLQYFIPIIVIVAPLFTFFSRELLIHFTGYSMGFELLGVNAAITVLGLYLSSFYIPK